MYCAACGYPLSTTVDGVDRRCTECGRPYDPDDRWTWETRRRPPRALVGIGATIVLAAAIVGWIALALRFDYGHDFTTAVWWFLTMGAILALTAVVLAVRNRSWWGRVPLLGAGVLAGWAGLAMGVDHGFRVWQSGPNPPDEAFVDGAQGVVAFLTGWIPASIVVAVLFLGLLPVASGRRRLPKGAATASVRNAPRAAPPTSPIG